MSIVTTDQTLEKWFGQLKDVTEIRDTNGNVLGTFTPNIQSGDHAVYEKAKGLFDPIETERILREEQGQGIPLAEFWQKMEAQSQP